MNKVEALPFSSRLCCPTVPKYYGLLRLPSCRITISPSGLIGILFAEFSVQGRVSPVHYTFFDNIPLPVSRKVLRCCFSKFFTASMAFVQFLGTRHLLLPPAGYLCDAAEFTLCYGLLSCRPLSERHFRQYASTHRSVHTQVS